MRERERLGGVRCRYKSKARRSRRAGEKRKSARVSEERFFSAKQQQKAAGKARAVSASGASAFCGVMLCATHATAGVQSEVKRRRYVIFTRCLHYLRWRAARAAHAYYGASV